MSERIKALRALAEEANAHDQALLQAHRDEIAALRAQLAAVERERWAGRDVDLIEAIQLWARGTDRDGVGCWCEASSDDHECPTDDAEHATGCVRLRRMVGPWDGRIPRAQRVAEARQKWDDRALSYEQEIHRLQDHVAALGEAHANLRNAAAIVEHVLRSYAEDQHEDVPEAKARDLAAHLATALRATPGATP